VLDFQFITKDWNIFSNYYSKSDLKGYVCKNWKLFTDEFWNSPSRVALLDPDQVSFSNLDEYILSVLWSKAIIRMSFDFPNSRYTDFQVSTEGIYDYDSSWKVIELYRYFQWNIQWRIWGNWINLINQQTITGRILERIKAVLGGISQIWK
jgi:hypothetical protein